MKLFEARPGRLEILKYVDRYQYFDIDEASFLKTIPNGKLDAYIMLEGGFDLWDYESGKFIRPGQQSVLKASGTGSLLRIKTRLVCLNIKLNLNILSSSQARSMYVNGSDQLCDYFLTHNFIDDIKGGGFFKGGKLNSALLDEYLIPEFQCLMQGHDSLTQELFSQLGQMNNFSIKYLADKMNVSAKTLERLTKRYFNFTPKALWNIIRFERTTAHLRQTRSTKFIDALSFGYYDHSHFIKECRRITGLAPGEFFSTMQLPTNDLAIFKNKC